MHNRFRLRKHLWATLLSFAVTSTARADCTGPASIQAELRTNPKAAAFVRLGKWFEVRHKYECAAEAYRSAVQLNPRSAQTFELLGTAMLALGNLSAAASAWQQSVKIDPGSIAPHLKLAKALEELGRGDEAKSEWETALKVDPKSVEALDGMSRHLIADGDYGAAIRLLLPAAENSAAKESLILDLAQAYGKSGMLDDAEALVRKSLAVRPSSLPLTSALITVLMNKRKLQEAKDVSGRFAESHPQDLEAQRLYLRVLVTAQDWDRETQLARKLLTAHPQDPYVLYATGVSELRAGDYSGAKLHLEQSVALDPNFAGAHFRLGLALVKLGDAPGAKREFEEVLKLGNAQPEAHFELAKVLNALGKNEEAQRELTIYREAVDLDAARSLAQARSDEAQREMSAGNAQKAAALYREALQATPEDALLHYKLSLALDSMGDTAGEHVALEKAVQIDPDMAIAQNQLGYLDSREEDYAAAEQHFQRAVRAAPDFTDAWINLAATLGMESKFAEAEQAIASALKLDPKNDQARQLKQDLTTAQERQK